MSEHPTIGDHFQQLTLDECEILRHRKTQLTYLKGETIFKQGAFAPYVYYVLDGLVKVYLQTGLDKQINLSVAKKGDLMAFSSVFGEAVHTTSAMALNNATICMIDKEGLKTVLQQNTAFALEISARHFKMEHRLIELINNLSYKQMRGKLASALLYLNQLTTDIFTHLTRADLADFAGISTESAIKFLKEFEADGVVVLDGKNIVIRNPEKLNDISVKG